MNKSKFVLGLLLLCEEAMTAPMPTIRTEALPVGQSIASISTFFLDRPFVDNPLGEGPGSYDSDPLYRTDAFDCTTFVETVWAISQATGQEWKSKLQRIRYRDGKISFANRLHFISHDWMPYHESRGALIDLTQALDGKALKVSTRIDRRAWVRKMHPKEITAFTAAFPAEKASDVTVPYIPFASFLSGGGLEDNLRAELRKGALLVNFVRVNWKTAHTIGSDIDISHQGFMILKGDRIVLHHASAFHKRVVETDFLAYLDAHRQHPSLKGLQILRVAF